MDKFDLEQFPKSKIRFSEKKCSENSQLEQKCDTAKSYFSLDYLQKIIAARADVRDGTSYTASLVSAGMGRAAKKLGEEAVETVIAAIEKDKAALIAESADLLYHLAIVWHMAAIEVDDVLSELARRTHQSGLEEKASRDSHE